MEFSLWRGQFSFERLLHPCYLAYVATRTPIVDPIARRIRTRRGELGLSLAQASARAGIKAPSFLHHIERGERIPSEEVVVWLAAALQEDDELLRAWVRLRRGAPLDLALAAARLLERHLATTGERASAAPLTPVGNGNAVPSQDGASRDDAGRGVESKRPPAPHGPPLLLRVPRLGWGVEPGASNGVANPAEVLRLDPRALPEEAWHRPFAYRLPAEIPLPAPLKPGDLVLITRNAWPLLPSSIYLVREGETLRLSRVSWRDGRLWLASERLGQAHPLAPSGTPPRDLLGRVGAVIRAGSPTQEA